MICLCDGVNGLKDILYQQQNKERFIFFMIFEVKALIFEGPYGGRCKAGTLPWIAVCVTSWDFPEIHRHTNAIIVRGLCDGWTVV